MIRGSLAALAVLAALASTACSGGGSSLPYNFSCDWSDPSCPIYASPPPTPGPEPFCAYPSGEKPQMIYPIPGSTGVSDAFNAQGIVLADRSGANYDDPNVFYMAWLGPEPTESAFVGDDTPVILSSFYHITAAQVPQPAAAPLIANPVYEASSTPNAGIINPILPHTHYYVYLQRVWVDDSGNECLAVGPVGDFTTE